MKVEIVGICEFKCGPVHLSPGDELRVDHVFSEDDGHVVRRHLARQQITSTAIWSHSILFKLNGELTHLLGNQATVDWIEGLADES